MASEYTKRVAVNFATCLFVATRLGVFGSTALDLKADKETRVLSLDKANFGIATRVSYWVDYDRLPCFESTQWFLRPVTVTYYRTDGSIAYQK